MDPTLIDAQQALALVLARNGDYAGAIALLQQYLTLSPDDAQAEGDLADILRANHQEADAAPFYAAALAHGSHNAAWESALAWQVAENGSTTADQLARVVGPAKDACDQTAGKDPFALYLSSLVLARLDRFDDAIASAEQARAVARRTGQTDMADAIAGRLTAYRMGLATTRPATRP